MHPGWSKYTSSFHDLITACVGFDSSCPKRQSGFPTPDSFCTLAVACIVVPEIQPAHLTTHLDSLSSFLAPLVPVLPVCYLAYPLLAPCTLELVYDLTQAGLPDVEPMVLF